MDEQDDSSDTADASADAVSAGAPPASPSRRGIGLLIPILLVAVLIIGGGTALAFTVPVMSFKADRSLDHMLPATTAFYIAADLNPSGATKDNLQRIQRAFTGQPGWANLAKMFQGATKQPSNAGGCYRQTESQATANLGDLGHTAALALIGTKGLSSLPSSGTAASVAAQRDLVFLASLDVHLTIADALSGFNLSLPSTTVSYKGVTIYEERFPSCGKVATNAPATIYAAEDAGYVILGVQLAPIKRIVDVAGGSAPDLASVAEYRTLAAKVAGGSIGSYFFSGSALKALGVRRALQQVRGTGGSASALYSGILKSSLAALYAEPDGLRMMVVAPGARGKPAVAAGELAPKLSSGTLAYYSTEGLAATLHGLAGQLAKTGMLSASNGAMLTAVLSDVTADMSGEADIVLFRPAGTLNLGTSGGAPDLPLAVLWKVNSEAGARGHLSDIVQRLGLAGQLHGAIAPDGTSYDATSNGYGYAVHKGWAIVSLSIGQTIASLSTPPGQGLTSVSAFVKGEAAGTRDDTIYYLNAHDLRLQLEAALLPKLPSSSQAQYRSFVLPLLAPIEALSGSTGTATDGTSVSTAFVQIAAGS